MKLKYNLTLLLLLSLSNAVCAMQGKVLPTQVAAAAALRAPVAVEVRAEEREVLRLFNETMRRFPELFEIHRQLAGLKALVAGIDYKKITEVTITLRYPLRAAYDAMSVKGLKTLVMLLAARKESADKAEGYVKPKFRPMDFALDLTVDVKKLVELLQTLAGEDGLQLEDAAEEKWQLMQRFLIQADGTLALSDGIAAELTSKLTPEIIRDMQEATGQIKMVIEKINAGLGLFLNYKMVEVTGELPNEIKTGVKNILGLIKVLKDKIADPKICEHIFASLEQQNRLLTCIGARMAARPA